MSFREKSAWISFVLLLMLTLAFVISHHLHPHDAQGRDLIDPAYLFFGILLVFVLLQVGLHVVVAMQSPKEARTPKDERERFIELRAARIGFYTLVVGELTAMALFHLHGRAFFLMSSILLAIFIAWLVKLGTEIVLYRRGA
jgi:hypothetical protein